MSSLRINRPDAADDNTTLRSEAAAESNGHSSKASEPRVGKMGQSSTEDSVRRGLRGPQKPKGEINSNFDLAPVPHSKYQFFERFREILVSLSLVRPRGGAHPIAWRMLREIKPTNHPDDVSQMKSQQDILAIKLTGNLAGASAVHIMNRGGFILDSAIKLDDGTWVFSKAREAYGKNASILFQTERNDGKVKNESLPLKALKAH